MPQPSRPRTAPPQRNLDWGPGWLRAVGLVAAFVVLALLVRRFFPTAEAWISGLGPLAPLVFLAVHAAVVPLGFPVSVLGLLAGASFGFGLGALVLTVAALVTASLIFLLSRRLLASQVRRFAASRPRVARFLDLAGQDSLRLMVLLRLSPLHFGLICYLAGASRTRFGPYLLATFCVLPSAVMQAYIGHTARQLGEQVQRGEALGVWQVLLAMAGIVGAVLSVWLVGRLAQRALQHTADERAPDQGVA